MKKFVSSIFFVLLIFSIIGCTINDSRNGSPNSNPPLDQDPIIEDPINQEPKKSDTNDQPMDDPIFDKPKDNISLFEAFPEIIFSNPEAFLQQLIPGFKLGINKVKVENLLGKPIEKKIRDNEWDNREEWSYRNIKGYNLILIFDSFDQIVNFQLSKELAGKGFIPKVLNKPIPTNGEPINYNELGFEEVLVGTSFEEVLKRSSEPISGYISFDEMYGYNLSLIYQGITIHILLEKEDPYIQFIETNDYGILETYRGVKVGSSVDIVIEKYGEPQYDWVEVGDLIYATGDYWFAIKFYIENDIVTAISIYEASWFSA